MVQARSNDTLPGRVSRPRILFDCGCLFGQVVIDAAEHGQVGGLFVGDPNGAQRVGHGPGGFAVDPGAWTNPGVS